MSFCLEQVIVQGDIKLLLSAGDGESEWDADCGPKGQDDLEVSRVGSGNSCCDDEGEEHKEEVEARAEQVLHEGPLITHGPAVSHRLGFRCLFHASPPRSTC